MVSSASLLKRSNTWMSPLPRATYTRWPEGEKATARAWPETGSTRTGLLRLRLVEDHRGVRGHRDQIAEVGGRRGAARQRSTPQRLVRGQRHRLGAVRGGNGHERAVHGAVQAAAGARQLGPEAHRCPANDLGHDRAGIDGVHRAVGSDGRLAHLAQHAAGAAGVEVETDQVVLGVEAYTAPCSRSVPTSRFTAGSLSASLQADSARPGTR